MHTESLVDLERQSPPGHPKKTTEANSKACTGAGEAGKKVSQLSTPLQVSFEDETCVNTPRRGPPTRSKVNCRQTQLTDSFARIGAQSSTKCIEDQSPQG